MVFKSGKYADMALFDFVEKITDVLHKKMSKIGIFIDVKRHSIQLIMIF